MGVTQATVSALVKKLEGFGMLERRRSETDRRQSNLHITAEGLTKVRGAPVELMPFEEVLYWPELTAIYDWTRSHVLSTLNICWGAQAALHHFHGIPKHVLPAKRFGVYAHRRTVSGSTLLRGFDDEFLVPVSRHTENHAADLDGVPGLDILAVSAEAGLCLVQDLPNRQVCMFNHLEYDSSTLADEYHRDVAQGRAIQLPHNYFPGDDPTRPPTNRWRAFAHLLFGNWINDIYQCTPYVLEDLPRLVRG